MENAAGAEVAAVDQKVWLYAEDGKTLLKTLTSNATGWVDFGAQPEHFAIAYMAGKQLVYQTINQNPGEIKVVMPFDETVQEDSCPVSKSFHVNGIKGDDFAAHTSHPEWITKLEGNTLTICAARAPLDGKFDLWLVSSAGYQHQEGLNWQGAADLTFSPLAPTLSNWTLTPGASSLLTTTILITNAKQLTVFDQSLQNVDVATTSQLALPRLTGTGYTMKVFALDYSGNGYTISRPLDSLSTIPSTEIPSASVSNVKLSVADQMVSWSKNAASDVDFFELSIELDKGVTLVTLLDKGQTSFKVPQIPAALGSSPKASSTVVLSGVDYRDYSNLVGWQDATQSPLITLGDFIAKLHSAESNATRTTRN